MIKSGLTSVTFRKLKPEEIIVMAASAGLDGIEWGGDIHVPHGETATARNVAALTVNAGLRVSSYGSYYKTGVSEKNGLSFEAVLDTAQALGAPRIRVWAGDKSPRLLTPEMTKCIIEDTVRISGMAEKCKIGIAFEYHPNTVTEDNVTAFLFGRALAGLKNVSFYWQPPVSMTPEQRREGLDSLISEGRLSNLHVYSWEYENGKTKRLPFSAHRTEWQEYLSAASAVKEDRYALLEFVRDDSAEAFYDDAACLRYMLSGC